jgi:replication factor A1
MKYEVDADNFFNALISAGNNRRSTCGNLSIECRGKQRNKVILLITTGQKVVAQFPLPHAFLLERNNPIRDAREADALGRHSIKRDRNSKSLQIKDLRIGMKSVSLKAKVLEVTKSTLVVTRFGNYASVANALISDDTGKIKLCLWNEQINCVSVGDTVQVENARISAFRGERQLRVGKSGILRVAQDVVAN